MDQQVIYQSWHSKPLDKIKLAYFREEYEFKFSLFWVYFLHKCETQHCSQVRHYFRPFL
jgi:hypothetical protein